MKYNWRNSTWLQHCWKKLFWFFLSGIVKPLFTSSRRWSYTALRCYYICVLWIINIEIINFWVDAGCLFWRLLDTRFFCFRDLLACHLSVSLAFCSLRTHCMSMSPDHCFQLNYFDSSVDLCCICLVLAGCRCIVYQDRSVCPHQLNSHWHSMCGGCLSIQYW